MKLPLRIAAFIAITTIAQSSSAHHLIVKRGTSLDVPSKAAAQATSGDTILIEDDVYSDGAVWLKNNLTIIGKTDNGSVRVTGAVVDGDNALWIIKGSGIIVQGISFDLAQGDPVRFAGIRVDADNTVIRNCDFHDNDNGITTKDAAIALTIESCSFHGNGFTFDTGLEDATTHNINVGKINSFTLRGSWIYEAYGGSSIRSGALHNYLDCNRIIDSVTSKAILVTFPFGGETILTGNSIQRMNGSLSKSFIGYGEEISGSNQNPIQTLALVNNTFANQLSNGGTYVFGSSSVSPDKFTYINNLIIGPGTLYSGKNPTTVDSMTNRQIPSYGTANVRDFFHYDYYPLMGSPVVDQGTSTGLPSGVALPTLEYIQPQRLRARPTNGAIDIGAYEYSPSTLSEVETPIALVPGTGAMIYPNPGRGDRTMMIQGSGAAARVSVYTQLGENVMTSEINTVAGEASVIQLSLGRLQAGIYYVRVMQGKESSVTTLVVMQ